MRALVPPLVALVAITGFSGCDNNPVVSPSPVAATTPVTLPATPAPTPTPIVPGVLALSSFVVTPVQVGPSAKQLLADFTLTETAGGTVMLEDLKFEDSAGHKDFGCLGDPLNIPSHSSLDGKSLGYCQPIISTQSPVEFGEFASLTAVYKQADGRHDTVQALIRVYGP